MCHAAVFLPHVIQLNLAVNEAALYQHVIRSIKFFGKAVVNEVLERITEARGRFGDADPLGEENSTRPEVAHVLQDRSVPEAVSDAMVSVWGKDNNFDFEPLEEAVDGYGYTIARVLTGWWADRCALSYRRQ